VGEGGLDVESGAGEGCLHHDAFVAQVDSKGVDDYALADFEWQIQEGRLWVGVGGVPCAFQNAGDTGGRTSSCKRFGGFGGVGARSYAILPARP
jgi:hypothetical protein